MPGVEVVSTAITHLVAGDGIVRDYRVRIADALAAILLPLLLVGLLAWRRSALGIMAAAAVMIAWAGLNTFAFTHGVWLNAATTLAAAVPRLRSLPVYSYGPEAAARNISLPKAGRLRSSRRLRCRSGWRAIRIFSPNPSGKTPPWSSSISPASRV